MKISGRFVGSEATTVYLEQTTPLATSIIDSALLDKEGGYGFLLKEATPTPTLYNLLYNGTRIPLLLAGGDRVTVSAVGSVLRNYTVDGDAE